MKKHLFKVLGLTVLLSASLGAAHAVSINGYTTASNVYSGSSSRSWFGGGVEYALAQWRMEKDVPAEPEVVPEATSDVSEGIADAVMEATEAPSAEAETNAAPASDTQAETTIKTSKPDSPTAAEAPSIETPSINE